MMSDYNCSNLRSSELQEVQNEQSRVVGPKYIWLVTAGNYISSIVVVFLNPNDTKCWKNKKVPHRLGIKRKTISNKKAFSLHPLEKTSKKAFVLNLLAVWDGNPMKQHTA